MTKSYQHHPMRVCVGAKPRDAVAWWSDEGEVYWPGRMSAHCGHWMINLRCPHCGREGKFTKNYLGGKPVLCDGRLRRPNQYTLEDYVTALDRDKQKELNL